MQRQPDHLPDRAPRLCGSIPTRHVPSTSYPPPILEGNLDPRSLFLLYSQSLPPEHQPRFSSLLVGPHVTDLTQHSSVQFSRVRLFSTSWTAACQASLSITNSQSLLKFMSIKSVMPSNHLILCHPLLLPSIFPGIRVFSSESVLCIRWPKYWSFSFSISPSSEYSELISFRID